MDTTNYRKKYITLWTRTKNGGVKRDQHTSSRETIYRRTKHRCGEKRANTSRKLSTCLKHNISKIKGKLLTQR